MGNASSTNVSLLERIQHDPEDQAAWEEFVERYGRKIYRWCRHWGLQEADAEDVTQGLLFKLVEKLKEFQYDAGKGSFRGWLKTLTHHAWHDFVNSKWDGDVGAGGSGPAAQFQTVQARDDLVERLKSEFDLELLEAATRRVRERVAEHTWTAFELLEQDGLPATEVAARVSMQVAMVYVARSKVKRMLHEEIQKLEETAIEAPQSNPRTN